jgi:hypothetical protein
VSPSSARRLGSRVLFDALPWLAGALACWPLLQGLPRGHDWPFELVRAAEYRAALAAGQMPPWWAENLYGGYGSPIFLFYAPLYAGGTALLSGLLGSLPGAATAALALLTALSVGTMLVFLRAVVGDPAAARIGSVFYVLHPYLLGDKLLRSANAEFAALALAPLPLAGVALIGARPRAGFAALSAGLALCILAHNLTALVVMGLVALAAPLLHAGTAGWQTWLRIALAIALGLAMAAFFWLPAVSLTHWVRIDELVQGPFDFHGSFPSLAQALGYGSFFSAGLLTPLALGLALFALLRHPACGALPRRLLGACLAAAAGCLFLITPMSTLVWEHVPLLPLFQFPWRMQGPLALMSALAAALAFAALGARASQRRRSAAEIVLFAACVANALPTLIRAEAIVPAERAVLAQRLAPRTIRAMQLPATVVDEYLPRAARREALETGRPVLGPVVGAPQDARVAVLEDHGTRIALSVQLAEPGRLRIARWSVPGWRLELDGRPSEPLSNADGSLDVDLPAGETQLLLRLETPALRRAGAAASAVAFLVWLWLVIRGPRAERRGRFGRRPSPPPEGRRRGLLDPDQD